MRKYSYLAVFEPNGSGGFGVYFPDLSGCVSFGNDFNHALKMAEEGLGFHIYTMEKDNHTKLLYVLRNFENIRVICPKDIKNSIGVVSCLFDGYSSDNIGQILAERDIAIRTGLHCAPHAHKFLDTFPEGTVRFSVSYFNDKSEFESLKKVLQYIADNS